VLVRQTTQISNPGLLLLLLCLGLLIGTMSACGPGESENSSLEGSPLKSEDLPVRGGLAVIALPGDPDVLNPLIRRSADAGRVLAEILDTLAELGDDLEHYPRIAESWTLAPDSLSITYHLHPWVWENEEPLTAWDVAASFRLFKDPLVASPSSGFFRNVTEVEVLDERTLRYRFSKILPDPISRTTHAILPLHRLSGLDPALVDQWPLNQHPVASGPFSLVSWEHSREIVLEPNPNYPLEGPFLSRVCFKVVKESAARVMGLEAGEIDFVSDVAPQDAKRMQEQEDIQVFTTSGRKFYYLMWNCRNPIFSDSPTRRALSLAIDRERMINSLLEGFGEPAVGPIAQVVWNFHRELSPDPYDPESAAALLAEAGWNDENGDGCLERGGLPLEFEILTRQGDPVRTEGLTILRENFQAIGGRINVRTLELAAGLDLVGKGEFDSYFGAMNPNLFGDPSSAVHSAAVDEYNYGFYSNVVVDSLLSAALGQPNRQLAMPTWNLLQEVLQEDQPAAYLICPQRLDAASRRIRNVRPHVLSPINNLSEWWIAPSDRKYRTEKDPQ
jgi:peptide/nickel transport system substrate-binding protein